MSLHAAGSGRGSVISGAGCELSPGTTTRGKHQAGDLQVELRVGGRPSPRARRSRR